MSLMKKYNISSFIIYILIITLILTIINLIIPINNKINEVINLILICTYTFINSMKKGLKTDKKAYIEGLKLGIINIILLYILGILTLSFKINLKRLIYFITIIIVSILGCIIGINKKRTS